VGVIWFILLFGLLASLVFLMITNTMPSDWWRRKEKRMLISLEVKTPKAPQSLTISTGYDAMRISMDRAVASQVPDFLRALADQVERELQTTFPIQAGAAADPESSSEESLTTRIRLDRIEALLDRIKQVLDLKP
jgi:hypothetical protein